MSKWSSVGAQDHSQTTRDDLSNQALIASGGVFNSTSNYQNQKLVSQSRDALDNVQNSISKIFDICKKLPKEPVLLNSDGTTTAIEAAILKTLGADVAKKINLDLDFQKSSLAL